MSDPGSLVPITDEQAKLGQEVLKTLQGVGGFLKKILGTVPEDLVGLLGGDWLKLRRAENLRRIVERTNELIEARKATTEEPSISIALPMLIEAANESRDELQEIWARLMAAAADPERSKSFRAQFIDAAKQMDPLDGAVLATVRKKGGAVSGQVQEMIATDLKVRRDEVSVSMENLTRLKLMDHPATQYHISPFGREFLVAISD
jgi:hypothetical protein